MTNERKIYCLFAGVVAIWAIFALIAYSAGGDWPERAQIGDMFGVVNSLFSGLAFAGLLAALCLQRGELRLQRIELKLQRKELGLTRKELKRSAEAQEASEDALRRQAASLKLTAKINAIDTLIRVKSDDMNRAQGHDHQNLNMARKDLIIELQEIVDGKSTD